MPEFRTRLAELITRCGKTQKELAAACGIAEAAVSRYLSGERMPGAAAAVAMARELGVSTEYLMGQEESFERTPEVREMLEALRMRPELRALLFEARSATTEETEEALHTLKRLKEQRLH